MALLQSGRSRQEAKAVLAHVKALPRRFKSLPNLGLWVWERALLCLMMISVGNMWALEPLDPPPGWTIPGVLTLVAVGDFFFCLVFLVDQERMELRNGVTEHDRTKT